MSTPVKGLGILLILLLALYNTYPTFVALQPGEASNLQGQMLSKAQLYEKQINEVKVIGLALADAKANKIQVIHLPNEKINLSNPALAILSQDYDANPGEESSEFVIKAGREDKVFVSKTAEMLNSMVTHANKIKNVELGNDGQSIRLTLAKNRRVSDKIEPLKSILNDEMELTYLPDESAYILRPKVEENVVSLGLDLQGGMYQDIGVDVEAVVDAYLLRQSESLEDRLIEENVNYELVQVSGKMIELTLEVGENIDLTKEIYAKILEPDFEIKLSDLGYQLVLKPEEEERIKNNALDQALETIRNRIDLLGVKEPSIQKRGNDSIIIQLPGLKDPDRARRVIGQVAVLNFKIVIDGANPEALTREQELLFEEVKDPITKEIERTLPWVVDKKVLLQGSMIRDARVGFLQTGEAYVSMSFDDDGSELFAEITKNAVGKKLAIVLDNKVQSAPRINEPITGGEAQITGSFSPEEASELALVLRSGALPAPIVIHEERTIGASLGEDSIRQALISLCLGFAAVMLFMMVYYRVSGIFSVLALIFNLLLIVAALAYFQATLTLPGMAGIILTIGMAVDANVLIFERIREELTRGNSARKAIQIGFQKATVTILDANITTIMAAVILFQFGTGPIKGFAVTLSIGIVASMFTAIFVSRFLFEVVYLRRQNLDEVSI
ncbi:MAG: protein translocase subunit SecD [SAR324 cluster bacterium]|nr:protein translocase subunit SecD [SAR324 cluster bacterium]